MDVIREIKRLRQEMADRSQSCSRADYERIYYELKALTERLQSGAGFLLCHRLMTEWVQSNPVTEPMKNWLPKPKRRRVVQR